MSDEREHRILEARDRYDEALLMPTLTDNERVVRRQEINDAWDQVRAALAPLRQHVEHLLDPFTVANRPSPAESPSGTRGKLLIGAARLLREAADQFVCDGRPALARKYRAAADALMRRERPGGPEFLTPESGETAVLSREDRGWIVEHCEEMQHYTKNWLVAEQARIILAYERTLNAALLASPAPPEGGTTPLHETIKRLRAEVVEAFDRATNQPSYQESVYAHDAGYGGAPVRATGEGTDTERLDELEKTAVAYSSPPMRAVTGTQWRVTAIHPPGERPTLREAMDNAFRSTPPSPPVTE